MKRYKLSLTMAGPLMATGIEAIAHGVDAPFLRDDQNRIIIPGSQVRGIVRHVLTDMAKAGSSLDAALLERWFGKPSAKASATTEDSFDEQTEAWEPAFGQVRFSDLVAEGRENKSTVMTRIAIDSFTGSVSHGSLQVLEQPIGVDEHVEFSGVIEISADAAAANELADWIKKALMLTPAIGAHKSAGFGRVVKPDLGEGEDVPSMPAAREETIAAIVKSGAATVRLKFDGPFLVSSSRWNTNLYSGNPNVPGSVLKAVLAQATHALSPASSLHRPLAGCVVTELRPVKDAETRPRTPPVSLYHVDDGTGDGLLLDAMFDPPMEWAAGGETIAFAMDWKQGSTAFALRKKDYPASFEDSRHVRTHTAINQNGAAETGKLFSFAAVKPDDYIWTGSILQGDLSDDEFSELLKALPDTLHGIGKTRVSASLELSPAGATDSVVIGEEVTLVLETDACLHTPDSLFAYSDKSASEQLRLQYQAYFADALRERAGPTDVTFDNEVLALRFYATQRRVGGYVSARYAPVADGYYPWLLTNAGSVFRFKVPKGCADAVQSFFRKGLPAPAGFDAARKTWQGNPFVPENGFGEVRLNIAK